MSRDNLPFAYNNLPGNFSLTHLLGNENKPDAGDGTTEFLFSLREVQHRVVGLISWRAFSNYAQIAAWCMDVARVKIQLFDCDDDYDCCIPQMHECVKEN